MSKEAKNMMQSIVAAAQSNTQPYDTQAEVKRIEGNTAWVHIPGGLDETPVSLTIDAKEGDTVHVRISGGRAWLVGNSTAPPTDDTTAKKARTEAERAQTTALDARVKAIKAAGTATEYISVETDGIFVHAKGMPEDPTDADARGVLIDDDVDIIREGESVATFGANLAQIGTDASSNIKITDRSIEGVSDNGPFFSFNQEGGTATDTLTQDLIFVQAKAFPTVRTHTRLNGTLSNSDTVTVSIGFNPNSMTSHTFHYGDGTWRVQVNGYYYDISVSYTANRVSYYVESRDPSSSYIRLTATYTSTFATSSFAIGTGQATGGFAMALNRGTIASSKSQTVIGAFNKEDTNDDYSFIIGNGTTSADEDRSNALTVNWDGAVAVGDAPNTFAVSTVSVSVAVSSANSNVSGTASATKSGYYPIGVVGFSVTTAGAYSRGCYLSNVSLGSCTVNARLYATATGAKSCDAYVLWVKTT